MLIPACLTPARRIRAIAALACVSLTLPAFAADRDVQIVNVNFETSVVTLKNFGATDVDLSNWRWCTSDDNQTLQYTDAAGFAGKTIEAGTEFAIHFANDGPGGADSTNLSDFGGNTALPLDRGPYGMAIYSTPPFFTPDNMVDYVQWSDSASNPQNASADARAATADAANLWMSPNNWVIVPGTAEAITFIPEDLSGGLNHSSADYEVIDAGTPCPGNLDDSNNAVDFNDLLALFSFWGPCPATPECPGDLSGDGNVVDFDDLLALFGEWGACP